MRLHFIGLSRNQKFPLKTVRVKPEKKDGICTASAG